MSLTHDISTQIALSSGVKVVGIPELLECILLNLSPIELLRANGISHTFAKTIAGSVKLQQKLYLKADSSMPESTSKPNVLLRNLFRSLKNICLTFTEPGGHPYHMGITDNPQSIGILLQLSKVPQAGSCTRMYLTQPPTKAVDVYSHSHTYDNYRDGRLSVYETTVKNEAGVTWGDACKVLAALDPPYDWTDQRIKRAADMVNIEPTATSIDSSALDRVFDVTELLELILLCSTPMTVLRSMAACRKFKSVVAGSVPLQKKLCLKADLAIPVTQRLPNELLHGLRDYKTNVHLTFTTMSCSDADAYHQRITPIPTLDILLQLTRIPRPGGNAANMFLTQPPATAVKIWSHRHGYREKVAVLETTVTNEDGVTW